MRLNKKIFDAVKTGIFVGDTKYVGRITVEPDWQLRETPPVFGTHPRDGIRGPYRYYQTQANEQVEIEVPNIKSFTIDGDVGQDVATCKIQMYNQWHHENMEQPDAEGQLGKPGYFWPQRAMSSEAAERWNQTPAVGAFDKHGSWDGGFEWRNCLVPNALLRTYEGVGGQDKSIQQALDDGDIMLTGVWLIDSVVGGTDGILKLECRDIGRLLLDQLAYPPLVPPALYPLEYYPEGESPFDSFWTPPPSSDQLSPGEYGTVRVRYHSSSADVQQGTFNALVGGTTGRMSCDGDQTTYSLSPATATPSESGAFHWWQYSFADGGKGHQVIHGVDFTPWAGGYTAYISVFRHNHGWLGTETVPGGVSPVPYVKAIRVPLNTPDGQEWRSPRRVELPEAFSHTGGDYPGIDAEFVRITLGPNMYYSGVPDGVGQQYRCGLREVTCRRRGSMVGEYAPGGTFEDVRWTFTMASHPVRGYWVVDSEGWVHGFGDAADWDSDKFGAVPITSKHPMNKAVGIAAHPSGEGYWVVDRIGHVYAYGAAKYYGDPVRYWPGSPPSGSLGPALTYDDFTSASPVTPFVTDITAHYNGEGYWVSHGDGLITLYGTTATLDEVSPVTHFGTSIYNGQRMHFTGTSYDAGAVMDTTRRGSDGGMHRVIAFLPSETHLTTLEGSQTSEVYLLEPADNPFGFIPVLVTRGAIYRNHRKATAIASHPHLPFVFVTDGSGHVWIIGVIWHGHELNDPVPGFGHWRGQLYSRIYNSGQATEYRLSRDEYPNGIEVTATGKGYWLAFGGGRIASFGDAEGQGPINIWEDKWTTPVGDPPVVPARHGVTDWSFFRALTHDVSRDPDGKGFYVLLADGTVRNFDAKPWGQPGFHGQTGWRWHDGNMEDYSDIVRDLLRWGGFTLYGNLAPGEAPPVYGNIETTGVQTDTKLDGAKWDKRTLIDCINQIKDVVAYNFWIDQEGAAHFESPNWWYKGNRDELGLPIFVTYDGNGDWTRVDASTPGAQHFVPTIDEEIDLSSYAVQLDGKSLRSEIIVGSDTPDPDDPTITQFVRYLPESAHAEIRPGVPALRGIQRPALWVNQVFTNKEEQKLMAELVALQIWFSQRVGSVSCTGNPNIWINDQVMIKERHTSEYYVHYVRSVSRSVDVDKGTSEMTLSTNWLGDDTEWVLTTEDSYDPLTRFRISEVVDRWQHGLGLGLPFSGGDSGGSIILSGEFD